MRPNWMQVLGADNFLPVLDAAQLSASKVIKVSAIIVTKQNKWRYIYSQTECKFWI